MATNDSTQGVVACGHRVTAKAAREILEAGGNAFDAAVAAPLAACVAEPVLTSLGGGGFLLARTYDGRELLYDYFVQTPKRRVERTPGFYPVHVDFGNPAGVSHRRGIDRDTRNGQRAVRHSAGSVPPADGPAG